MPVKYGIPIAKNKRRNSKHIQKSNGERHCLEIMWESDYGLANEISITIVLFHVVLLHQQCEFTCK
jgi:hypothetical protein